jgi:tetratricopeptide (TPR) repeat protein
MGRNEPSALRERARTAIAEHRMVDAERHYEELANLKADAQERRDVLAALATVTQAQGLSRARDAATRWMDCLHITERCYSPAHPVLVNVLEKTCSAFELVGQYRALVPLRERQVEALRLQGPSGALVSALKDLALAQRCLGSQRPAKLMIDQATELLETLDLRDDETFYDILANLVTVRGLVALDEGDPNAVAMLVDAFRIDEQARGDTSAGYRSLADVRENSIASLNVAMALLAVEAWGEAASWLDRARRTLGSAGLVALREADLALGLQRIDEADADLDRANATIELAPAHPRFAEIRLAKAAVWAARGARAESERLAREALVEAERSVYHTSPFLSRATSLLGK